MINIVKEISIYLKHYQYFYKSRKCKDSMILDLKKTAFENLLNTRGTFRKRSQGDKKSNRRETRKQNWQVVSLEHNDCPKKRQQNLHILFANYQRSG